MPTTLPSRSRTVDQTDGLAGFLRGLLRVYFGIASLFVSIETTNRAFAGHTLAASMLFATGLERPAADELYPVLILQPAY